MKVKLTVEIELNETAVSDRLSQGDTKENLKKEVVKYLEIRHQLIEDYTVINSEVM